MASDPGDVQNSKTDTDASGAQGQKRPLPSKASDLFASAPTPDVSDLPGDSHEIATVRGARKDASKFRASDLLALAQNPASSKPLSKPEQQNAPPRRKRVSKFKASEMLGAAPVPDAAEGELPHQLAHVDKRGPSAREIASGIAILCFVGVVGWLLVGRQQEDAQRTVCAGNLRELSLALFQYAQDNDESLPNRLTGWPGTVTTWNQQEGYTWRRAVAPYFKSKAALRCPTNPKNTQPTGCQVIACGVTRVTDGFETSYACNYNNGLGGAGNQTGNGYCGGKGAIPARLSGFASPSQLIAVVETVSPWSEFNVLKPSFSDAIYTGHHGLSNYLFADGHVAPLAPVQTLRFWRGDGHAFSLNERDAARSVLGIR